MLNTISPLLAIAGLFAVVAEPSPAGTTEEVVAWFLKGIIAIGIVATTYLIRDAARTLEQTRKELTEHRREFAALASTVAAHQIMFEHWFDGLTAQDVLDNPGRRAADQIVRMLLEQREVASKGV